MFANPGEKSAAAQDKPGSSSSQQPAPKPHADVQALLDKADALATQKNWPDAEKAYDEALIAARRLLDKCGEATTLFNVGNVYYVSGQLQKAMTSYEQAVPLYQAVGDKPGEAKALFNLGNTLLRSLQTQKALSYFERALPLYRAAKDRGGEAGVLNSIGVVYLRTFQLQKALTHFEQALPLFRASGNKQGEANALNNLGNILYSIGQAGKALEYSEQALPLYRAVGDKPHEAEILSNLGTMYLATGQPQKALSYSEEALSLYRVVGDKRGEANALNNMGNVNQATGQPQKARTYFQQALPFFRASGDKRSEASVLNNLGNSFFNTGQPQEAVIFFQQALPLFLGVGDKRGEAKVVNNLGNSYYATGQPQKAMASYEHALPIFRDVGDKNGEADALNNIGNVYQATGQLQKSLAFYEQALPVYRAVGSKGGEASASDNIGNIYRRTQQPQKAMASFEQALPIYRAVGDKHGEAVTLNNIGAVCRESGQPGKALKYYDLALPLYRTIGDKSGEAHALNNLGNSYADTGQPQRALDYYAQAQKIFQATADTSREAATLINIGLTYQNTGQPKKAMAFYLRGLNQLEKYRGEIGTDSEAKEHFLASLTGDYHRYIALLLEQGQLAESFAWTQKVKARVVLDLLKQARIDLDHDLSTVDHEHLADLRADIARLNKEQIAEGLHSPEKATQQFQKLGIQLAKAQDDMEGFRSALYRKYPGLANREAAVTLSQSDLPRLLPADTALLEYVTLRVNAGKKQVDRTLLYVGTMENGRPKLSVIRIAISKELLAEKCEDFRGACADKALRSYRGKAEELYRLLIAPAAKLIAGKKRLLFCPDEALWALPFQALVSGTGQHLWERYELAFAYSATGALAARTAKRSPGRIRPAQSLLVIANPDFGDASRFNTAGRGTDRPLTMPSRALDMPSRDLYGVERGGITPLPGTHNEAQGLHTLYPEATVLEGKEAQEATVKSQMSHYRYLHFATHGLFNNAVPMLSSIVLAQPEKESPEDGFLTAGELFEMKLSAELVTLSACETARGEVRTSEGIVGLTWALFAAGVPSAVVSQWKVDDTSTPQLMGAFYSGMKRGEGKAGALRKASLKLLHDGSHSHPYYWAPFVLVGNWD